MGKKTTFGSEFSRQAGGFLNEFGRQLFGGWGGKPKKKGIQVNRTVNVYNVKYYFPRPKNEDKNRKGPGRPGAPWS
jgi:hypothetical protein